MAATCLFPTVKMLSDPDFINQNIAYWIADGSVDFQAIVDLIR